MILVMTSVLFVQIAGRLHDEAALLQIAKKGQAASAPVVKLNNGVEMPVLAFAANMWSPEVCKSATLDAIKAGFRFIWSSEIVGAGCQDAQASAITESPVPRSDLFVAGTVDTAGCSGFKGCYEQTKSGAQKQYEVLQQNTLDMLMLDYPPGSGDCDSILGQWAAFEELYPAKVRSIAVSNFLPEHLQCIKNKASATVPSVNQLLFNFGKGKEKTLLEHSKLGIVVQAYSPLGAGSVAANSVCQGVGARYGKSAAQVALKWILQHNVSVATQSTDYSHLQEDAELFDFTLSDDDMQMLDCSSGFSSSSNCND